MAHSSSSFGLELGDSPLIVMLDVTHTSAISSRMIVSYRDKRARDFAAGRRVKALSGIERAARLKLDRLEAALALKDLAGPSNVEILDYH